MMSGLFRACRFALFVLALFFAPSAYATCSNPFGEAGRMIVNADHSTLQYCNGTSWISMSPPSDDRCISGALSNSDRGVLVCSDGAIYAGEYNGHYLFAWPADEPTTLQYKSPRSGGALGSNSADDGVANTNVQMSIDPALFFAAKACRDKGEQWYLPAVNELDILNKAQGIGLFSGTYRILGSWYWSSTGASGTNTTARSFNFTNENLSWPYMDDSLQVRCVRRRPAFTSGVCSGPDGTVGDIIYNDDHRVMQWCDGNGWKLLGSVATGELTDTNVLSGLTGHWKLNDGSGLTATDSSGLGNHSTLTNMDESTDWVSGKIGGALDFDGANDYVIDTSYKPNQNDNTPALSTCAWFFSRANQSKAVVEWRKTGDATLISQIYLDSNSSRITTTIRLGSGVGQQSLGTSNKSLYCWGSNGNGQIGDNSTTQRLVPTAVSGGGDWIEVSVGDIHTCGIRGDNTLHCWGSNSNGRLGDNSTTQRLVPTEVSGGGSWISVSAGSNYTCGIRSNNTLYCWGNNSNGRLGDNSMTQRLVPTPISGGGSWISVSAGNNHTCGIRDDNALYCWGLNSSGQIGDGSIAQRLIPTLVSGGGNWLQVSAGAAHSCGILNDDSLHCWGSNMVGQLGDNSMTDRLIPTPVSGGGSWYSVASRGGYTCGIKIDNSLHCWGGNNNGGLGDGTTEQRLVPTSVSGGGVWTYVSPGQGHTCGIHNDKNLLCWGANGNGQLGNGAAAWSLIPISVAGGRVESYRIE